ncbi:MATE family efflux transporter [Thalassotalea sp. LPB0316]|nr:MATE family efflux transporter [Thalassotalea sp. LPB0316]
MVHKPLFALAFPMIISNITVPLLGLVDTAVIGHLPHAYYLGASAVGAMIITFITWLCGFLRMSSTGLSAQTLGKQDVAQSLQVLLRGLLVSLTIAIVFILAQSLYFDIAFFLAGGSAEIQHYGREYAEIRIWGLPASLGSLVILGWLLGQQQARPVMWLLIITNLCNLVLDLLFVLGFNWGLQGVACATLIAEYLGFITGLAYIAHYIHRKVAITIDISAMFSSIFKADKLKQYFALNRDILIRTLCLEVCFVFITFQGARLGDEVVASNAILMNFVLLISFGLDGIANGAEAMVGKAHGANDNQQLKRVVDTSLLWTFIFALGYSLFFAFLGEQFIALISDIESVRALASTYLPWIVILPILACWCYLYDGIYVGLMQADVMRNSMIFSTFGCFFPAWYLLQSLGNHAIWGAFSIFMIARGLSLAWHFHNKSLSSE